MTAPDHGHGSGHPLPPDRRRLLVALAATVVTALVGITGAALTGSLALVADVGHLLTDAAALVAAVVASVLVARPRDERRTFGLLRAETLVAAGSSLALLVVLGLVLVEGLRRLGDPSAVPGLPLLAVGALGLAGNLVSLLVLRGGDPHDHNLRAAALHVAGDALGSVGVLVAAVVVLTTGWPYADTVAGLVIVALVLPRALALLRATVHVLLDGVPPHLSLPAVEQALRDVPGVQDVHDLHVWGLNARLPTASAHLVVAGGAAQHCGGVLDAATQVLRERFALEHVTLQVEQSGHAAHERACD